MNVFIHVTKYAVYICSEDLSDIKFQFQYNNKKF